MVSNIASIKNAMPIEPKLKYLQKYVKVCSPLPREASIRFDASSTCIALKVVLKNANRKMMGSNSLLKYAL